MTIFVLTVVAALGSGLIAGVFFAFSTMHEAGYRAAGNTRLPLLVVWCVAVSKICGNALLIGGAWGLPALGMNGAALATLAAYVLGLSLYLWLARRRDLAESAVLLLSDAGRFITGQVLAIDGGWSVSDGV